MTRRSSTYLKYLFMTILIVVSIWITLYFTPEKVRSLILQSGNFSSMMYVLLWIILPIGFSQYPC